MSGSKIQVLKQQYHKGQCMSDKINWPRLSVGQLLEAPKEGGHDDKRNTRLTLALNVEFQRVWIGRLL